MSLCWTRWLPLCKSCKKVFFFRISLLLFSTSLNVKNVCSVTSSACRIMNFFLIYPRTPSILVLSSLSRFFCQFEKQISHPHAYSGPRYFFLWPTAQMWPRRPRFAVSKSHTRVRAHTRPVELLWSSDPPVAEAIHNTYDTNMPNLSGIRTCGPGKRAAEDPCLRPRGQRDRPKYYWGDEIQNAAMNVVRKGVREVLAWWWLQRLREKGLYEESRMGFVLL